MNCEEVREHLVDYLYGELPAELEREVASALEECPRCAAEYAQLKSVREAVAGLPRLDLPPPVRQDILREARLQADSRKSQTTSKILSTLAGLFQSPAFAAACVICLVLAVGWLLERQGSEPGGSTPSLAEGPQGSEMSARGAESPPPDRVVARRSGVEEAPEGVASGPQRGQGSRAPSREATTGWQTESVSGTGVSVAEMGGEEGRAAPEREPGLSEAFEASGTSDNRAEPADAIAEAEVRGDTDVSQEADEAASGDVVTAELARLLAQAEDVEPVASGRSGGEVSRGGRDGASRQARVERERERREAEEEEAAQAVAERRRRSLRDADREEEEEESEGAAAAETVVASGSAPPAPAARPAAEGGDNVAALSDPSGGSAESREHDEGWTDAPVVVELGPRSGEGADGVEEGEHTVQFGAAGYDPYDEQRALNVMPAEEYGVLELQTAPVAPDVSLDQTETASGERAEVAEPVEVALLPEQQAQDDDVSSTLVASAEEPEVDEDIPEAAARDYDEAVSRYNDGSYREAVRYFDAFIQNAPRTTDYFALALFLQGEAFMELGNYRAASGNFRRIIVEHPDFERTEEAQYLLGQAYENDGRLEEAEQTYRTLADGENPFNDEANEAAARVRRARRDQAEPAGADAFRGGEAQQPSEVQSVE